MSDLGIAIAVHLVSVVWWLGGIAFVTAVMLPAVARGLGSDPHEAFRRIEQRFAPQARVAVILAGLSGGYLLWRLGAWTWLGHAAFWWLDAMIGYWLLFLLLLFVIEPLGLMRRAMHYGNVDSDRFLYRMIRVHALLLVIGLVIVGGAAAGSHGY
jgi:uncharacterized membrane protein